MFGFMKSISSILLIFVTRVESGSDVNLLLARIFILSSVSFLFAAVIHWVEFSAVEQSWIVAI